LNITAKEEAKKHLLSVDRTEDEDDRNLLDQLCPKDRDLLADHLPWHLRNNCQTCGRDQFSILQLPCISTN